MSTITCPAAETARSAAATYDVPFGKSRSSEVCERNTRHPLVSPEPFKPANRVTPSIGNTLNQPATRASKRGPPARRRRGGDAPAVPPGQARNLSAAPGSSPGRQGRAAPRQTAAADAEPEAARTSCGPVEAGISQVRCGDHVSFAGAGFDGLAQATALAMLHPALPIYSGVYLLPLRYPVLVARQLADIDRIAPGRLIFGVGVGGEDRHGVSICGVDPATRGRRMNECLTVVRQLLTGTAGTFHGKFFDLDDAVIAPAPPVAIPIITGVVPTWRSSAQAGRDGGGHLELAPAFRRCRRDGGKRGRPHRPAPPARPSRDAGVVRAGGLEGGGSRLPCPGDGGVLPAPVRAVRARPPLRHARPRCRVPRPLRRCWLRPNSISSCTRPDHDVSIAGTAAVKGLLA